MRSLYSRLLKARKRRPLTPCAVIGLKGGLRSTSGGWAAVLVYRECSSRNQQPPVGCRSGSAQMGGGEGSATVLTGKAAYSPPQAILIARIQDGQAD